MIFKWLKGNWEIIVAIAVFIGALTAFFKNYLHAKNLWFQNKNLLNKKSTNNTSQKIGEYPKKEALDDFEIGFSEIARKSLDQLGVTEDHILFLISEELKNHAILLKVDYQFSPRPLRHGFFSIISKEGKNLVIDNISKSPVLKDFTDSHNNLCGAYFEASRLRFRTDHNVLLQRNELKHSLKVVGVLIMLLSKFLFETKIFYDEEVFPHLHKLKKDAQNHFDNAEIAYNDVENGNGSLPNVGTIAIDLDIVISSIHKILIDYRHLPILSEEAR